MNVKDWARKIQNLLPESQRSAFEKYLIGNETFAEAEEDPDAQQALWCRMIYRDPIHAEVERLRVENATLRSRPKRVRALATGVSYAVLCTGLVCMEWGTHLGLSWAVSNAWSGLGAGTFLGLYLGLKIWGER